MGVVDDLEGGRKTIGIILVQLTQLLAKSPVSDVLKQIAPSHGQAFLWFCALSLVETASYSSMTHVVDLLIACMRKGRQAG